MLKREISLQTDETKEECWIKTADGVEDSFHFRNQSHTQKHKDHLCMELTINGEPLILRSGIIVDRKFMDGPDTGKRDKEIFSLKENCAYIQSSCIAYMNQREGVLAKRKIIAIGSRLYILMDEYYAVGEHIYEQMFQFPETGKISILGNSVHYQGEKSCMDIYSLSGSTTANGSICMVPRDLEEFGNETKDTVLFMKEGGALKTMFSIIHCYDRGAGQLLEARKLVPESFMGGTMTDQQVEAAEIEVEGKRYIASISHQDISESADLFRVGDCTGYGNVLVFDASTEEKTPIVLR